MALIPSDPDQAWMVWPPACHAVLAIPDGSGPLEGGSRVLTHGEPASVRQSPHRSAIVSACGHYRYALWRRWGPGTTAMVIGLNPSTADAHGDDPTSRRCIRFAQAWGHDALCLVNLFAFRATRVAMMKAVPDPVGPANDHWLLALAPRAAVIVAAWGNHGDHLQREQAVRQLLSPLHLLRLTQRGHPAHPLYLPNGLRPALWLQP